MIHKAIVVLCLLLALTTIVVGVRSYRREIVCQGGQLGVTGSWDGPPIFVTQNHSVTGDELLGLLTVSRISFVNGVFVRIWTTRYAGTVRPPDRMINGFVCRWGRDATVFLRFPGNTRPGAVIYQGILVNKLSVRLWGPLILFLLYPLLAIIHGPLRRRYRRKKGLCVGCGYNLTGNVSGICPECGQRPAANAAGMMPRLPLVDELPGKPDPLRQRDIVHRVRQAVLILSTLGWSWLGMMVVHEFGHVLGAWATGGTVAKVVLYPTSFSRTDLAHNPHPLIVAWAGAVVGALLPVTAHAAAGLARMPGRYLLRFFAGFCLVANGAYLGVGWIDKAGDAGDLLRYGAATWQLTAFGLAGVSLGLRLWHGIGRHFGLGREQAEVRPFAAYASPSILIAIIAVEFLLTGE